METPARERPLQCRVRKQAKVQYTYSASSISPVKARRLLRGYSTGYQPSFPVVQETEAGLFNHSFLPRDLPRKSTRSAQPRCPRLAGTSEHERRNMRVRSARGNRLKRCKHSLVTNKHYPKVSILGTKEFAALYDQGCKNRTTAATALNASSSRSHAVLQLKV